MFSALFRTASAGRRIKRDGYIRVRWQGKRVYLHRLVWELANGRPCPPDHVIHHIDGNKANNRPTNLSALLRADHIRAHDFYRRSSDPVDPEFGW